MHPGWGKYSVGVLTLANTIRLAIASGHTTFDFLRGDEAYKSKWAREARRNVTLRVFQHSPAGMAARMGLKARKAMSRAAKTFSTALGRHFRAGH